MTTLTITKKHHKHLNNPFPANKETLPLIYGTLFLNSQKLPSHEIYNIGKDFQLNWSSKDGGFVSISHKSEPTRPLWSTIPGEAFISAAMAETEVDESRGSFVIKDKHVHLICNHQTIEDIKIIHESDITSLHCQDQVSPSFSLPKNSQFPILMITGKVFGIKNRKKKVRISVSKDFLRLSEKEPSTSARYWALFDQKNSNQVGLQVRLEKPNMEPPQRVSSRSYRSFSLRFGRIRRRRAGWFGFLSRKRSLAVSSAEEKMVMKTGGANDFNRTCVTYSSERNEKFFGFGEQFSHMDFKGKRVPIFVQEQGIGRGDQPITFAANLVSYRAGGDWSTTYAPSPFYMTSKMRSLYLEGYNYSVFDLTRDDRIQIQLHGNSFEGRILHGTSPSELIEHFTESIGRPPPLPEWIISGAVVGMQGGTNTVRSIWNEMQRYDVPVSAFWLQVHLPPFFKYRRSEELLLRWMEFAAFTTVFRTHEGNKPSCNSQFYSNNRTLSHFARLAKVYKAWKFYRIQLVKEASQKGLPICRHLFLHYPEDEHVHKLTYEQFLVGTEILVVPVLDKGREKVKAYFPLGESSLWRHIWTGNLYSTQGSEAWVEAPIGYPAIFVKDGSPVGETFLKNLSEYNVL